MDSNDKLLHEAETHGWSTEQLTRALGGTKVVPSATRKAWGQSYSWPLATTGAVQPWSSERLDGTERVENWWERTDNNTGDDDGTP